ncbi:general secretion pathway protein GspB [Massilia sp. YIM B02443]|uniref:general secretion pathway protein GspB n=1 Tax=Massilia sp. YIM B02443 TaxID=3050127 RepID=UPI0025B63E03|nr:general secretion pathway protein GspB [Massilia sp. YIM B02443]MDN4036737.1 general secretion pathway protein GspB [Massilia sp. YIM B02443]
MSYILEALKKAQAERQLGSAPTIHAPAQSYAAAAPAQGAGRRYAAVGAGTGVLVALAVVWWTRQGGEQAPAPAVVAQAPAPITTPAPAAAPPAPAPAPAPTPAPAAAPAAAAPAPASAPSPVVKEAAPTRPAVVAEPAPEPAPPVKAREAAPARVADAPPAPVAAPAAVQAPAEDTVRTLQQLPEAIQREIPKVAFGGYIYSPDPAERLLLVDKMLRREGEEVAPGLVLERLLPKAAVMNYRGYRYRVAY